MATRKQTISNFHFYAALVEKEKGRQVLLRDVIALIEKLVRENKRLRAQRVMLDHWQQPMAAHEAHMAATVTQAQPKR